MSSIPHRIARLPGSQKKRSLEEHMQRQPALNNFLDFQ
uniref:Uncharacterized protein n=1 Tax=Arundo donax TaxID=35708 RepID=A0A0A9D281_ARUDO